MDTNAKNPEYENLQPNDADALDNDTEKMTDNHAKKSTKSSKKMKESAAHESQIGELEENLAELNDKYLRLFSEFDNYRKRTNKERIELIDTASIDLILELLPVLDDFDRAIQLHDGDADPKVVSSFEGSRLIYSKLKNLLMRRGLEPMKSVGETFDTDFHEAVTNIPAPSPDLVGKVVDEIQKGYMLKGKVIRFARVVVGQ
jgi:molecular chaperone GrpE